MLDRKNPWRRYLDGVKREPGGTGHAGYKVKNYIFQYLEALDIKASGLGAPEVLSCIPQLAQLSAKYNGPGYAPCILPLILKVIQVYQPCHTSMQGLIEDNEEVKAAYGLLFDSGVYSERKMQNMKNVLRELFNNLGKIPQPAYIAVLSQLADLLKDFLWNRDAAAPAAEAETTLPPLSAPSTPPVELAAIGIQDTKADSVDTGKVDSGKSLCELWAKLLQDNKASRMKKPDPVAKTLSNLKGDIGAEDTFREVRLLQVGTKLSALLSPGVVECAMHIPSEKKEATTGSTRQVAAEAKRLYIFFDSQDNERLSLRLLKTLRGHDNEGVLCIDAHPTEKQISRADLDALVQWINAQEYQDVQIVGHCYMGWPAAYLARQLLTGGVPAVAYLDRTPKDAFSAVMGYLCDGPDNRYKGFRIFIWRLLFPFVHLIARITFKESYSSYLQPGSIPIAVEDDGRVLPQDTLWYQQHKHHWQTSYNLSVYALMVLWSVMAGCRVLYMLGGLPINLLNMIPVIPHVGWVGTVAIGSVALLLVFMLLHRAVSPTPPRAKLIRELRRLRTMAKQQTPNLVALQDKIRALIANTAYDTKIVKDILNQVADIDCSQEDAQQQIEALLSCAVKQVRDTGFFRRSQEPDAIKHRIWKKYDWLKKKCDKVGTTRKLQEKLARKKRHHPWLQQYSLPPVPQVKAPPKNHFCSSRELYAPEWHAKNGGELTCEMRSLYKYMSRSRDTEASLSKGAC